MNVEKYDPHRYHNEIRGGGECRAGKARALLDWGCQWINAAMPRQPCYMCFPAYKKLMDITLWGRGSVHDLSGEKQRNRGGGEERRAATVGHKHWKAYKMSYTWGKLQNGGAACQLTSKLNFKRKPRMSLYQNICFSGHLIMVLGHVGGSLKMSGGTVHPSTRLPWRGLEKHYTLQQWALLIDL